MKNNINRKTFKMKDGSYLVYLSRSEKTILQSNDKWFNIVRELNQYEKLGSKDQIKNLEIEYNKLVDIINEKNNEIKKLMSEKNELIKIIKNNKANIVNNSSKEETATIETIETTETTETTVDNDTLKEPIKLYLNQKGYYIATCPTCKKRIRSSEYKCQCGQFIKWPDNL